MTAPINESPAVVVRDAHKSFSRPHEQAHTLKERALHPLRARTGDTLEALRGVSFDVARGEFFGIVGRNGSGKSTLLKCMGGIYSLTQGGIWIDGRLSPFIELGVGFNPELAARDNVVLNGIMLGLSPREARRRYDEVIDFAELREFQDLKLKNYSSGMHVRLAFSVAIQVDADVLLIDEVLAVGDAAFQQKCFDVFGEMRAEGRTILFVTHDMQSVTRFCHRAMLIERGEMVEIGDPKTVADRYIDLNFQGRESTILGSREASAELLDGWIEDENGEPTTTCVQGRTYTFKTRFAFHRAVDDARFTMIFVNDRLQDVLVATTSFDLESAGRFDAGETVTLAVTVECMFRPGRYRPAAIVAPQATGRERQDRWDGVLDFTVVGPQAKGGIVDVPHRLTVERASQAAATR